MLMEGVLLELQILGFCVTKSSTGVMAVIKRDRRRTCKTSKSDWPTIYFLEAQNRKLVDEMEKLKAYWEKETRQIKTMFSGVTGLGQEADGRDRQGEVAHRDQTCFDGRYRGGTASEVRTTEDDLDK